MSYMRGKMRVLADSTKYTQDSLLNISELTVVVRARGTRKSAEKYQIHKFITV
jgi:hypothetical protein